MTLASLSALLPRALRDHVLHFDAEIERSLQSFAQLLPPRALVIDAGAGEVRHARYFSHARYFGIDLAIGDASWNYSQLAALADLQHLPVRHASVDAVLNIVTLEHVPDPAAVIQELARILKPGGKLLLVAPLEWEEHQIPHDYFRYTRYGLRHLIESSGLHLTRLEPVGGYFRLLQRRLAAALQFFPLWLWPVVILITGLPVLVLPWFDVLDRHKRFTLGFIVEAEKSL